ncbi:RHS repeat protein [Aeromonas veronii]|nr:RHS repeat protein [Aeromonas veronii]
MANPYYDRLNEYVPGELADGQAVEADFGAVQTGFERVNTDMQALVTKATKVNGKPLSGDIALTPGDVGAMRSLNGQKPNAEGDLVLNLLHGSDTADQYFSSSFTYDESDRVTEVVTLYPAGQKSTTFTYDASGRLISSVSIYLGRQTTTTYHYDVSGRLESSESVEIEHE